MIMHGLFHASPLFIYLIVTVVLLLESSGVPIANNTLLLLTGAMVELGHLNLWVLMLSAIVGSIAGSCLAYTIGERGGRKVLVRLTSLMRLNAKKVDIAERWFQKSGVGMIFISRLTPFVRPFACFLAGISRMPRRSFFAAASLGSIIWCVGMILVGTVLGRHWTLGLRLMQDYTIPTCAAIVVLIIAYFSIRSAVKRRLSARLQLASEEADAEAKRDTKRTRELLNI